MSIYVNARPTTKLLAVVLIMVVSMVSSHLRAQAVSWEVVFPAYSDSGVYFFTDISASDDNNCTAVGYFKKDKLHTPVCKRTTDGGKTWFNQFPGLPSSEYENDRILREVYSIDSLNVVAIGDSGWIIRTFDGGQTWDRQDYPATVGSVTVGMGNVHFSDPMNGIIVGGGGYVIITTNGGKDWTRVNGLPIVFIRSCISYGDEKYRVFEYGNGRMYTTTDSWKTFDSTGFAYDRYDTNYKGAYVVSACFTDSDTIVCCGSNIMPEDHGSLKSKCLMVRTTNGGKEWKTVLNDRTRAQCGIDRFDIHGKYGIGGGVSAGFIYTTDGGNQWMSDTLAVNTDFYNLKSFDMVNDNFGFGILSLVNIGSIAKATFAHLSVNVGERYVYGTRIYPNPADEHMVIRTSYGENAKLHIVDILGRVVARIEVKDGEETVLNTASYASGMYKIVLIQKDRSFKVSSFVVFHH